MRLKIRYANAGGFTRLENFTNIQDVLINEDFLHPNNESIALGFRNKDSSGLIEFSVKEFDKISRSGRKKKHLIKGIKALGSNGAINFD